MKLKARFFRQHSLETCGISCILIVLDAFGPVKDPTEKQENTAPENLLLQGL